MKALSVVADGFSRWIDSVAGTVITLQGWLAPPPVVKLIEGEAGEFTIQADQQNVGSILSEERY